jgi:hypothetical protein
MGAWWLTAQRRARASRTLTPARPRGTVILDNTPRASSGDGII